MSASGQRKVETARSHPAVRAEAHAVPGHRNTEEEEARKNAKGRGRTTWGHKGRVLEVGGLGQKSVRAPGAVGKSGSCWESASPPQATCTAAGVALDLRGTGHFSGLRGCCGLDLTVAGVEGPRARKSPSGRRGRFHQKTATHVRLPSRLPDGKCCVFHRWRQRGPNGLLVAL